jgi:TonB-dependent receptor
VALSDTTQNEPDQRYMNYYITPSGQAQFGDASMPFPQYPSRYFREIEESGLNYRGDWTVPLAFMEEESSAKTGYYYSHSQRTYKEQYFTYAGDSGFDPNNPNSYLNDPDYLQYQAQYLGGIRTNYNFLRYIDNTEGAPYDASIDVQAGYLMTDLGVLPWLRLIGGVRVEQTDISLDAPRNNAKAGVNQTDWLPGISVVITPVTNVNLRLAYGESLSRPSYRELAPVLTYLPDLGITALGNPNLQLTSVKSYDARLEWFPAPGDVLSAGVFYKSLKQPIELVSRTLDDGQVTWINRPDADLMGMEFEARKNMEFLSPRFKGLSLGGNFTLIKSSTKLTDDELAAKRIVNPHASDTRPLYEQSPYIGNVDLIYEFARTGTTFSLGANWTGPRIILAKSTGPDIYEQSPVTLDAFISQKLWKYWTLRLGVKNILDPKYRQTYGEDAGDNKFQAFRRGRTFTLGLTGEF